VNRGRKDRGYRDGETSRGREKTRKRKGGGGKRIFFYCLFVLLIY